MPWPQVTRERQDLRLPSALWGVRPPYLQERLRFQWEFTCFNKIGLKKGSGCPVTLKLRGNRETVLFTALRDCIFLNVLCGQVQIVPGCQFTG